MTALIRIYDKTTASTNVSLGITTASTLYTLFKTINYGYFHPVSFLVCACAGSALAFLAHTYLVYNSEVKNKGERNNIYSIISLAVVLLPFTDNIVYSKVHVFASNLFVLLGSSFPYPGSFTFGPAIGFLVTMLWHQIRDYKK